MYEPHLMVFVLATFGIHLDVSSSWRSIHKLMSDASVILLGVHFALHLKWVGNNIVRYVFNPVRDFFQRRAPPQVLAAQRWRPTQWWRNARGYRRDRVLLRRKSASRLANDATFSFPR